MNRDMINKENTRILKRNTEAISKNTDVINEDIKELKELKENVEELNKNIVTLNTNITELEKDIRNNTNELKNDIRSLKDNVITLNSNMAANNQSKNSSEIEGKKRLAELYLVISGLLFSGIQITNTISNTYNISQNNTTQNLSSIPATYISTQLPLLYLSFVMLIITVLAYYMKLTQSREIDNLYAGWISIFFGYIIASFVDIQTAIGNKGITHYYFYIAWIILSLLSTIVLLPFSLIFEMKDKIIKKLQKVNQLKIYPRNRQSGKSEIIAIVVVFLLLCLIRLLVLGQL